MPVHDRVGAATRSRAPRRWRSPTTSWRGRYDGARWWRASAALLRTRAHRRRAAAAARRERGAHLRRRDDGPAQPRRSSASGINEEWKRAVRYNEPLSLVLLAIEGLREVIDKRGAGTGKIGCYTRGRRGAALAAADRRGHALRRARAGGAPAQHALRRRRSSAPIACVARRRARAVDDDWQAGGVDGHRLLSRQGCQRRRPICMRMAARALERAREEGAGIICLYQHQGYLFQPKNRVVELASRHETAGSGLLLKRAQAGSAWRSPPSWRRGCASAATRRWWSANERRRARRARRRRAGWARRIDLAGRARRRRHAPARRARWSPIAACRSSASTWATSAFSRRARRPTRKAALERALAGELPLEERMRLRCDVKRGSGERDHRARRATTRW